MLQLAGSAGAAEVAKAGRYLRAVLDPDGHEKDEQADFDRRFLRVRRRRNGGVEGEFYLPVEAAARLQHWLDVYAKSKAEGDDRTLSVRNADAFIAFLESKIVTELLVLVNAESLPDDPATAPGSEPHAGDAPGRDSGRCESDIPECDGDRFGSDAPMPGDEHWADAPVSRDPGVDAPTCGDERPDKDCSATGSPNVAEPHSHSAHGDEHAEPRGGGNCTGNRRASGCPDEDRPAGDCPADDCTAGDYRHAFMPGEAPHGMPRAGADSPPGLGGNSPPGVWLRGLPGLILATGHLLPVSSVHRLARTSTLVRIVMDAGGQVLDMGRKVRLATPAQRRAVFAWYATCWVDGCPLPATMCQIDHAEDWSSGGLTDLNLLGPACQFHNRDRYRHPTRYTRRKIRADRWALTYSNPRTTSRPDT